jgi:AmiR/NasT family two-component response regulator
MIDRIPNFRGRRAVVLHPPDRNGEAIVAQLERLGLFVALRWPADGVTADGVDVMFFDSDTGFDGLFAWRGSRAPVPLVATLGSEAPGRIEWTLAQEPAAYLFKPVGSTGVFSALAIAFHTFATRRQRETREQRLAERLQMRGTVLRAAVSLMRRYDVDAETALRTLRTASMRRRSTLEAVSRLVLDGKWLPIPPEARGQESPASGRRATSG